MTELRPQGGMAVQFQEVLLATVFLLYIFTSSDANCRVIVKDRGVLRQPAVSDCGNTFRNRSIWLFRCSTTD